VRRWNAPPGVSVSQYQETVSTISVCCSLSGDRDHTIHYRPRCDGIFSVAYQHDDRCSLVTCDLCPKLEDLQIGLDITCIPHFFNTTVRSHRLAHLSISSHHDTRADSSHLLNVARHMDRLFPYLEKIVPIREHAGDVWREVKRILQVYKMVRLDDSTRRLALEEMGAGVIFLEN
jgi:hypothetical protein